MEKYRKSTHYNKTYTYKEIDQLSYEDRASFQKRYPKEQGGYRVIGAIGEGLTDIKGSWFYDEQEYPFFELQYKKSRYKIIGYIEVDEDTFIAIIGKDYSKFIQLFLGVMVVLFVCIGGWQLLQTREGPNLDPGSKKYEAKVEIPEDADPSKIAIPGYGDVEMRAGSSEAYVALWNPDLNPCYFKFEIVLTESEESIYAGGLIPPGNAVTTVKFNRSFDKGVYPITIRVNTYGLEDYTKSLNGGEIKTKLVAIAEE